MVSKSRMGGRQAFHEKVQVDPLPGFVSSRKQEGVMKIRKQVQYVGMAAFMLGIFTCVVPFTLRAEDAPRMDKDELKALLDNPGVIILDVRTSTDWKQSDQKIKGAVRPDTGDVDTWEKVYPKDKTLVLYCS